MNSLEDTFLKACRENDLTKVRACIDLGVNINCENDEGQFGLFISAACNFSELCDLLLRHPDIDVNKKSDHYHDDSSALSTACLSNHPEITRKIVSAPGVDVNIGPFTAAMAAVYESYDCTKILAEIPSVDWNLQNLRGKTAAIFAVKKSRIDTLRILKDIPSINWNLADNRGDTALTCALKKNDLEYAKIILSIPSLDLQNHNLKNLNIPKENILECMKFYNQQQQKINSNMNVLMSSLGFSSAECPVCLMGFTPQRQVFLCKNGHFTCGSCRPRLESCPKCRGDFTGRAHDFENILANNT